MACLTQCRILSHSLASSRGSTVPSYSYRPSAGRCNAVPRSEAIFLLHRDRRQWHGRRRLITRSTEDLAALTALARSEALERERALLADMPIDDLRARLIKHGFSESSLPASREPLLEQLAETNLKARAQVVSYPLRKTPRSPRAAKSFLVAPIDVEDVGFVNFLLDSGSSGALITGEMRERLGLSPSDGQVVKGVDSGGLTLRQRVRLPPLRLGPRLLDLREAYVTQLKSEHDVEVGGVLGLSFLRQYEVEISPQLQRLAFHPPGHIDKGLLDVRGMTCLRCEVLKGGLLGVPVSLNGSPRFPAILDLGANFSILNWQAAELAGVRREGSGSSSAGAGGGGKGGGAAAGAAEVGGGLTGFKQTAM
ncbi:hypothetical protein Agub_g15050 [Astrephomene gubernaculifera]|uniref:Peptidase A2 domain-containing protein n=1 Tax=Astrephomene gubernaculifera TaxID=47775 RepID=A0AAD3E2G0_9CHLO|nr:hypothetical protein Agub_g15050 [Astrephomene gubernaculifera]